jgi:amidase
MVTLADDSDLAGSIRIPAACCGLVGLKPSPGRVGRPDLGDVGAGHVSDGVLTRTVLDTAVALDVIAGYEHGDHHGDHHSTPPPAVPFAEAVRRRPRRLWIRVALAAPPGVPIDPQPLAAARRAADVLADLGHHVQEGRPNSHDRTLPAS